MKQILSVILIIFAVSFYTANSQNTCALCQDLAYVAEIFVQYEGWDAAKLESELKYLCSLFGSLQTECDTIVDGFGTQLSQCLTTQPVNTTQCCADVFLCSTPQPEKLAIRAKVVEQILRKKRV